jgi:hypothetical protein
MIYIFEILLTIFVTHFVWSFFHELSHLIAAKHYGGGLKKWKINLIPRYEEGDFVFASFSCTTKKGISSSDIWKVDLAPRVADYIGGLGLCLAPLLINLIELHNAVLVMIFFAGGVMDFIAGSVGKSEHSDLAKAAAHLGIKRSFLQWFGVFNIAAIVFLFLVSLAKHLGV